MKKQQSVLWCAVAAAGIAGLAGCAGQATHMEASEGSLGPVVKTTDDYRKLRFEEAFRGLRIEDGLVVIDRQAAQGLRATRPAEAIARGVAKLGENDFSGAVGEYRLAILADPASAAAYSGLGDALVCKKKDDMALAAYRTGVMHAPRDTALRLKFAETINRTGDLAGWADELENLLALDPEHGEAHARLAVARYYLGDHGAARNEIVLADRFGGSVPPQLEALLSH